SLHCRRRAYGAAGHCKRRGCMRSGGDLDRRSFLIAASSAAGGLTLGFAIPFAAAARAAGALPEITCWIALAPDATVTIRVVPSEMGQGALTGLAMLV